MTHYDTFAGRLRRQGFNWSDPNQTLGEKDIEYLTRSFLDDKVFHAVYDRIREKSVLSRQLDWGAWAIPATRSDILSLLAEWKAGWQLPGPDDDLDHKPRQQRANCLATVQCLAQRKEYVIVIEEF